MEYTDRTQTNWDEFRQENKSECCPVTGVSRSLSFAEVEHSEVEDSDTALLTGHVEFGRDSRLKLQTMFDKFLYHR